MIALSVFGSAFAVGIIFAPLGMDARWMVPGAGVEIKYVLLLKAAAGSLVLGLSSVALGLGRRMRVRAGEWEAVEQDPRPPIVYLRPFEEDGVE